MTRRSKWNILRAHSNYVRDHGKVNLFGGPTGLFLYAGFATFIDWISEKWCLKFWETG